MIIVYILINIIIPVADPLNIVIKLQYVNDRPVAKLSDVTGKVMCQDEKYAEYLRSAVDYRLESES